MCQVSVEEPANSDQWTGPPFHLMSVGCRKVPDYDQLHFAKMFADGNVCFYHASDRSTIALCDVTKGQRRLPPVGWVPKAQREAEVLWQEAVNTWLNPPFKV